MENKHSSADEDSDEISSAKKLCCTLQFFWIPPFRIPTCKRKEFKKKVTSKCLERGVSNLKNKLRHKEGKFDERIDKLEQRLLDLKQKSRFCACEEEKKERYYRDVSSKTPVQQPVNNNTSVDSRPEYYSGRRSTRFGYSEEYQKPSVSSTSFEDFGQIDQPGERLTRGSSPQPRPKFNSENSPILDSPPKLYTPVRTPQLSTTSATSTKEPTFEPQRLRSPPRSPPMSPQPSKTQSLVNEGLKPPKINPEPLMQRHRLLSPITFEEPVTFERPGPKPKKKKAGLKSSQDVKSNEVEKPAIRKSKPVEEDHKMALVKYYDPSSESEFWVDAMCLTEAWKSQQSTSKSNRQEPPRRNFTKDANRQWIRTFESGNRPVRASVSPRPSSPPREKSVSFADDARHHLHSRRGHYDVHRRNVVEEEPRAASRNRDKDRYQPSTSLFKPPKTHHGYLPSSKEDDLKRPVDVRDFVRFIATLSNNSVTSVGNKRKSIDLYRDYLTGNVGRRKKR